KTVMGDFQRSRSKVWWSNYLDGETEEEAAWGGLSRGSSSSPSSSHKSQDSGFSDSELSEQSKRQTDSPVQKSDDEVTENQCCECPNQQSKANVNKNDVKTPSNVASTEQAKSPECSCVGENLQDEHLNSSKISVENGVANKSPECKVDVSSQLPVKKLREKFLQDCICVNKVSERQQCCVSDKAGLNKSPNKQHNTQEQTKSENDENDNQGNARESTEQKNRSPTSLNRSTPVPKIRAPQKNRSLNETSSVKSPTPSPRSLRNECQIQSPIPSPRSSRNKISLTKCNNTTQCNLSPKQSNETANKNDSEQNSSQVPVCERSPSHTSTPKTTSTPTKLLTTPTRALRSLGLGKKNGRPVNLLNNFNSTPEETVCGTDPVEQWLGELASLYEPECMTTLQSKSLAVDLSHQVAVMAATATDTVRVLQESTKIISTEFAKLCQQLEYGKMELFGPLVQSLVGHMSEFVQEHCNEDEDGKKLVEVCDRLRLITAKQPPDKDEITAETATLGNKFTTIVDKILIQHISVLVGVLEEPTSDLALRSAISSLTTLGLEGPHLSRLVAQCSGIRALLTVCLESQSSSIRTAALRALATICCVVEAIRQLEQAGGVEILSETLAEVTRPEPEISEAAAVLAQITAPWVEDNHSVQGLSEQLPSLVNSLTRLASSTASCETLLLAAAALANLTFMEPRAVWPLLEHCTAGKLLQAVKKKGPKVSVFLQEQAATLIANMAAVPESRPHLADQRAVVALLCFLQIRHSPLQRAPEIAAAERVQQKSAIALSRLCSDPVVAAQVVELQGVNRLVRLCKEERERNHSDGVLVACLAALRKIAANCGTKVIEDLDAMELVEPRLLDSFLLYSSRQESYV
ncbi:hypothetical protein L9F63_024915, partial [Diploptera punctata]